MTTRKALEIITTDLDKLYHSTLSQMWEDIFGDEEMPACGTIDGEKIIQWYEVRNMIRDEAITHLACKIDGVKSR